MICSSSGVPSVVLTRAWVSPRVKSTEPCWRGLKFGAIVISRMSSHLRPSMRVPERIAARSTFFLRSPKKSLMPLVRPGSSSSEAPAVSSSRILARTALAAAPRSCLPPSGRGEVVLVLEDLGA